MIPLRHFIVQSAMMFAVLHAQETTIEERGTHAIPVSEQALWIDRHNFFRLTALPFAAGNMQRMQWSGTLAVEAQKDATECASLGTSHAGINVFTHASSDNVMDQAFRAWAVTPALDAVGSLTPPKPGDAVGVGVYNTYSQIVWATTNQVGCAQATCGAQAVVVCKYAPAGNTEQAPWYVHNAPGTQCPEGLTSKQGLCGPVVEMAPIPAGQHAYQVFSDFPATLHERIRSGTSASTSAPAPAENASAAPTPSSNGSVVIVHNSSTSEPVENQSIAADTVSPSPTPSPEVSTAPTPVATPPSDGNRAAVEAAPPAPAPAPSPPSVVTANANHQSNGEKKSSKFSAAGIAGVILLGAVAAAVVAVFVSYRRNQERQRDIIQNGGIQVL